MVLPPRVVMKEAQEGMEQVQENEGEEEMGESRQLDVMVKGIRVAIAEKGERVSKISPLKFLGSLVFSRWRMSINQPQRV